MKSLVIMLAALVVCSTANADYYTKNGHTYSNTCVDEHNKVISTHEEFQEIDTVCFVVTGLHSGIWGVYVPRGKLINRK